MCEVGVVGEVVPIYMPACLMILLWSSDWRGGDGGDVPQPVLTFTRQHQQHSTTLHNTAPARRGSTAPPATFPRNNFDNHWGQCYEGICFFAETNWYFHWAASNLRAPPSHFPHRIARAHDWAGRRWWVWPLNAAVSQLFSSFLYRLELGKTDKDNLWKSSS